MDEFDMVSEQGYAAIGIASARTVFEVALDGMADRRQLATDLMLASRKKIDFKKSVAVAFGDRFVFQDGFLGIGSSGFRHEGLVDSAVAHEKVLERVFLFFGMAFNERPVCFVDIALAEHVVEAGEGLGSLCEDHESADRAVDTVDHTAEHVSRLIVFLLEILLDGFR